MTLTTSDAEALHQALSPDIRAWLNGRHISDEIIAKAKLGYGEIAGEVWLTIPVFDALGELLFLKLKRPPQAPEDQPKGKVFPSGSEASLYPLHLLTPENSTELVVCEGEPDCLALWSHGIPAITSTAGAGTMKEEWLAVFPPGGRAILAYDFDEAGQGGKTKMMDLIREHRPDVKLGEVQWESVLGKWGKDVTDFFINPLCWPKPELAPELPQNV